MTELVIRDADAADIPAIHRLIESAYRGESSRAGWTTEADLLTGQRTDPDELAEIVADPEQAMLTAWDGEDLLACIRIQRQPDGAGYFGMLSVSPTRQASRLGYADTGRTLAFDYGNLRLGKALRDDLYFVVMEKALA